LYKKIFWFGTLIVALLTWVYEATDPYNYTKKAEAFRIDAIRKITQDKAKESGAIVLAPQAAKQLTVYDKQFIALPEDEKLISAAKIFANYYLLNYKERPKFCLSKGINIEVFADSFKKQHSDLLLKTKTILKDFDENNLYTKQQSLLERLILQSSSILEAEYQTDAKGICWLYLKNSESVAEKMNFSKAFPLHYEVLVK